ncbi:MAG: SpoIIE family protein phosphatase [Candidatus Eremiobacteraeota bacterium]|nr:SpoIIE family protein phosphatase [Candidatus Eremiobacteraeota bacterium]
MSRASRIGFAISLSLSIALLAVFFVATLSIRNAIGVNASNLQLLQDARTNRARILRLQLDEETGVRGYAAAGARVLLQPFVSARREFPGTVATLDRELRALFLDTRPLENEVALNRMWLTRVADPILRRSPVGRHLDVELLGKSFIDQFRAEDAAMTAAMQEKEFAFGRDTGALIDRVLILALTLGVALAFVLGGLAIYQVRLASESEGARLSYERERRTTEALQEALLRKGLPKVPAVDLHAVYAPAGLEGRVGGDWYDALALDDRYVLFSVGDVAGHGLQAAVIMSRVRQSIASVAIAEHDPAVILSRSNAVLCRQESGMVTAICGVVDSEKREFAYSGAGHPPMILVHRDGRAEMLNTLGPPLGVIGDAPYRTDSKTIESGSMLVLYTDGVIEQGRSAEKGERLLLDTVRTIDPDSKDPAAEILSRMLGNVAPADDVAILTLRFGEHAFVDR